MGSRLDKGGGTFKGIKLLLCENPLPPLDEAIVAAKDELAQSNYYTEPHSDPLRRLIAEQLRVPQNLVHINAGSELILRQIFDRLGAQVHLSVNAPMPFSGAQPPFGLPLPTGSTPQHMTLITCRHGDPYSCVRHWFRAHTRHSTSCNLACNASARPRCRTERVPGQQNQR